MAKRHVAAGEGSSLSKAFDVLDLFSIESPLLQIDDIGARLGFTRSTGYRYVKDLCDAGLLAPLGGGAYALGPRIIELERLVHLTDPLLQAGQAVLPELAQANPDCVALLCTLYRDKVLCILHAGPEVILSRGAPIHLRRARGLPFPLFRGGASLAILAHLPPHRARALYLRNHGEIEKAGLGDDWEAFRSQLSVIRRAGHATTMGQINPNLVAVGVPVLIEGGAAVRGSVSLIAARDGWNDEAERGAVTALREAAAHISRALNAKSRRPAPRAARANPKRTGALRAASAPTSRR